VLLCGGGARNVQLRQRLGAHLPGIPVAGTETCGVDSDYVEAAGFAWLAQRTLRGLAGNLPSVTGAAHFAVLGAIHAGRIVTKP